MNDIEKEKHLNCALIAKENIINDLNENNNLLYFAFSPNTNEIVGLVTSRTHYDYFITNEGVEVLKKDIPYIMRRFNLLSNEPNSFVNFSDSRRFTEDLSEQDTVDIYNNALKEKINLEVLKPLCLKKFEKYLNLLSDIINNNLLPIYDGTFGIYFIMMERNFQYISLNSNSFIDFFEAKSIIEDINFNKLIDHLKIKPNQLENKI